ncbi:hypothetical protein KEM54_001502 [Ascosphaera aggregata]|nr:hypothetical protein KEM54_001502 [Ascosphaera aggregata]
MLMSGSSQVLALGMSGVSFLYVFILTNAAILSQLREGLGMYPNIPIMKAILALALLYTAAYVQHTAETHSLLDGHSTKRRNIIYRTLIFGSVVFTLYLLARQKGSSPYHPIDMLLERSGARHQVWAAMAKRSTTLKEATLEYHRRYNRPPPPGFDVWYEYAMNRSSIIIDDFDQIHDDLLPFTAISPAELRLLTTDLISSSWNDVVAIHVRNGSAELQQGIKPTHTWMVKGVKKMVDNFAEFLPDMDIPLNINDEPRVAVPWEDIEPFRQIGRSWKPDIYHLSDKWSADRSLPDVWGEKRMFKDLGRVGIFAKLARPTCPPGAPVRSTDVRDQRQICLKCAAPHSLGQFLSKWSASGDICHQPDIPQLHGFLLSPNDMKVAQQLLPVFSQSKVSGFNDILYPSAWNYVDKAEYKESQDVPWGKKSDALFWRGTTTEGYSQGGNWAGMVRQRFVHLINNHTSTVSILLPSEQGSKKFKYVPIRGQEVQSSFGLNTSVEFTEQINRAEKSQEAVQIREFGLGGKVDFQVHWRSKYLFDTDGAAFSGRFLPFLQSSSVPFRSGLFRQWLDERLTAWVHYVPIDIRLHGLWSTLAYFAGARSPDGKVMMRSHDHEAQNIANAGRLWANETLRKEDMEIYMFRLLLEWGRLTDDDRDCIGFALPRE